MSEKEFGVQRAEEYDSTLPASRLGYGLTVCLDWNRMLIHRKTIRALGHPERVRLLINPDTRHFCIQGCDEKETCSFPVPREMAPLYDPFYIHSKFLLGQICALMEWNSALSYRVFGKINTHTNVMDFDLNQYMEVNLNEFLENDEVPEEFMKDYQRLSIPVQQEPPETAVTSIQPDLPIAEATPVLSRPTTRGFMGGLFDSVRLPDRKDKSDD